MSRILSILPDGQIFERPDAHHFRFFNRCDCVLRFISRSEIILNDMRRPKRVLLGPLSWIIMYSGVLMLDLPTGEATLGLRDSRDSPNWNYGGRRTSLWLSVCNRWIFCSQVTVCTEWSHQWVAGEILWVRKFLDPQNHMEYQVSSRRSRFQFNATF